MSLKVLIAEDHPVLSLVVKKMITELGHCCLETVSTEKEAVQMASEHKPELFITDVALEQGSGIRAANQIQKNHSCPVLFITGSIDIKESEAQDKDPRRKVLLKPFLFEELQQALRDLFPKNQQHAAP